MKPAILCLNSGSSSVKFALYTFSNAQPDQCILHGKAEIIDTAGTHLIAWDEKGALLVDDTAAFSDGDIHQHLLALTLDWLASKHALNPIAVGHRVVHGGQFFTEAVRVDEVALNALRTLIPLAPLHQPYNIAGVTALAALRPDLPHVACFDTAFHATLPEVERQFALPRKWSEQGIQRYGFHGLSYAYIANVLPLHLGKRAEGRIVVAHLGNGASLCALHHRKSVASTMGFTALDGLMMGTRCGNVDPGVLLYLLQEHSMSVETLTALLYKESGLLGVSGISADMRTLLNCSDVAAEKAVELFCYRVNREMGAMIAILQGLDAVVFTGGIGQHAAEIRQRICKALRWLGVELDDERNETGQHCITRPESAVQVWVIPTDEEWMVARDTLRLMV